MTSLRNSLLVAVLAAGGCMDASRAGLGDVNSIIVIADSALWSEVADTVMTALRPRIFAVRDEPMFNLTHATYGDEHWSDLRRFKQLLAIGTPDDPWVARALEEADTTVEPPAIVEAERVWARNQRVTALVVPEEGAPAAVRGKLDDLAELYQRRYRVWAQTRMYISGLDTALVDTLRRQGGFAIDIPRVYRWRRHNDSTFFFLNDNPDASQLVRWVTVTWRSAVEEEPTRESVLSWRDSLAAAHYDWDQTTQRERLETRRLAEPGDGGIEVHGVWQGTDEGLPQAGPFIARAVDCPAQGRRYLIDAWLYAPARDKYQYMIQLETLLDSFSCAESSA